MPALCLNRIKPSIMVLRSQPLKLQRKKTSSDLGPAKGEKKETAKEKCQSTGGGSGAGGFGDADGGSNGTEEDARPSDVKVPGRKIMVVVDRSDEARGALQWALTHALQGHDDILVLLHASTLSKQGDEGNTTSKMMPPRVYKLLQSLKKTCHKKRPEAQVEVRAVQGKDKGSAIVEEARKQQVSLLVLGQKKKHSTAWQILLMWAGSKIPVVGGGGGHKGGVVEYCIRNADCMAIAVRRKSKRAGGYLITTKRHKDFWLLA